MTVWTISDAVYRETRRFFKYDAGAKSDNKMYLESAPKYQAGIGRLGRARGLLATLRASRGGMTPIQFGGYLYAQGPAAAGDCTEMCYMALYHFTQLRPADVAPFPVLFIGAGFHAFVIAGYIPPEVRFLPFNQTSRVSVLQMCAMIPEVAESYVVDPWAGIFCPTIEYPFDLQRKLEQWHGQEKVVGLNGQWVDPRPADGPHRDLFINSILNSTFYIQNPGQRLAPWPS